MNYFEILEVPFQVTVDLDTLKKNYQQKAKVHHPDQGGNEEIFQNLTKAYNTLATPHERLKYLLKIKKVEFSPRGTVSDSVMDCFMPIGELSQNVTNHLKAAKEASSALTKALLSPRTMELQSDVESWIEKVEELETSAMEHAPTLDFSSSELQTVARDLAFLSKWRAELREKYAQLFLAD